MPPKQSNNDDTASERSVRTRASRSSANATLMPLLKDPESLIDGRKDPAKAQDRREQARKGANTRRRLRTASLTPSAPPTVTPQPITEEEQLPQPEIEEEETNVKTPPRTGTTIPPLDDTLVEGLFEGPHAVVQPAQIRRTTHRPASNSQPEEHRAMSHSSRASNNDSPAVESVTLQIRSERQSPNEGMRAPSHRSHTSTRTHSSDEVRRLSEAVAELQRNNRALLGDNQALQEELEEVRSKRSSAASIQRAGSLMAEEKNREPEQSIIKVEDGESRNSERRWQNMDEVEFDQPQQTSPRKVLESILGSKRRDRLTQAGLASSEITATPVREAETTETRTGNDREPRFAGVTFTRGNILKPEPKENRNCNYKLSYTPFNDPSMRAYDKWENWPSVTRKIPQDITFNNRPVVNMARTLPRALGRYMIEDEASSTMYAEIRTDENPQYTYTDQHPPETPTGYEGRWVITAEEPPRWEFMGGKAQRRGTPPPRFSPRRGQPGPTAPHDGQEGPRIESGGRRAAGREVPVGDVESPPPCQNTGTPQSRRPSQPRQGRQGPDPNDPDDPGHSSDNDEEPYQPRRNGGIPNDRGNRGYGNRQRSEFRQSTSRTTENSNPVVDQRIQKLSSKTMGSFNPDTDSVNQFCETLLMLVEMYGEMSVIAAIPAALEGRAKLWFRAHGMPRDRMRSIDGWIEALSDEFRVNTAVAREKARLRRYNPAKDKSVDDYYYAKLDLIRASEARISTRRTVEELWLGLPADFQALMDYDEMMEKSVSNFGHSIRTKDLSYRAMINHKEESRDARSRFRERGNRFERKDYGRSDYGKESGKFGSGENSRFRDKEDTKGRRNREGKDKGKRQETRDDLPPILPSDKWRKDDKGRTMKRKCRFCLKWHMDFECPSKPASYNISTMPNDQVYTSDDDIADSDHESASSTSSESDSSKEGRSSWKNKKKIEMSYHNVYSNTIHNQVDEIKVPGVNQYRVEELPVAFSVGTGVSYLSAQPCPVKAWIGTQPGPDKALTTGVADSGGASIIAKELVPKNYTILESPLKPIFGGIGNSRTPVNGYVVLPVHLPNAAAMSGDGRSARIAKLWVEFQVVETCPAGFLLGIDAMAAYKISIDYPKLAITLQAFDPPIKIPIATQARYTTKQVDPRIYAAEPVNIRPYSEVWVPVKFAPLNQHSDLLVTPVRHADIAEGTYASCSYAVMANDTSHLLMINPSPRPVRVTKNQVVGMYEPFQTNTPFSYYGAVSQNPTLRQVTPTAMVDSQGEGRIPAVRSQSIKTTSWTDIPGENGQIYPDIQPTLGLNDPDLTWHDGTDQPVDPFGLEREFKDTGPLQTAPSAESAAKSAAKSAESAERITPKRPPDTGNVENTFRWNRAERRARERAEADRAGGANKGTSEGMSESEGTSKSETMNKGEEDLEWDICPDLTRREKRAWTKMLRKFRKVFAGPEEKLGKVNAKFDMDIEADPKAIKSQQPYRTSPKKRKLINEAVAKLESLDVIEPSTSDVASPVIIVIQKGKPRFCVDLREVNSKTIADRYALPKQDSIFRALVGAIYFSIIDANRGYHQFGLTRRGRRFTAFVTENGFWQFKRIPFGLKNAPSHFQRAIDTILGSYRYEFALAFIDDIVIYSKTLCDHLLHVSRVLEALGNVGMTVSEKKCHFAYKNVELLGRRVSRLGLSTQEEKVKAITNLPYPKTIGQAAEIYGQFNYHRDFIKGFAEIARPITNGMSPKKAAKRNLNITPHKLSPKEYAKLRSKTPFPDSQEIRDAFEKLKVALSTAPVLVHPNFDKEFVLYTDACRKGIAGSLYQVSDDGKEHPVLFISRGLTDAETRYSATELECLAVVWNLHKLEHFVDGSQLKLFTDHAALKWIWNMKSTVNSRLFKRSLLLNPLKDKVTVIHRPGRLHNNVDPLSRNPVSNSVNLVQVDDEWREKLWKGYLNDKYLRNILRKLMDQHRHRQQHQSPHDLRRDIQNLTKSTEMDGGKIVGNMRKRQEENKEIEKGGEVLVIKDGDEKERNEQEKRNKSKVDRENDVLVIKDGEKQNEEKNGKEKRNRSLSDRREQSEVLVIKDDGENEVLVTKDGKKESKQKNGKQKKERKKSQVDRREESEVLVIKDGGENEVLAIKDGRENEVLTIKDGEKDRVVSTVDRGNGGAERELEGQEDGTESESLIEFYERIRDMDVTITDGTFSIIDNCLFFSERKSTTLRLCIPTNLIDEILHTCHDARAHPGVRRTYTAVALRFFFPRMSRIIKKHVDDCCECQTSKPSNERPIGQLQSIKSQSPQHTLCIDYITGLPPSRNCDALLTITDAYTKAIKLIPCKKTTTAEETAKLFLDNAYPIFGLPARIISDRDSRFTSKFWSTLMQLLGVKLGMTSAFHPQADGQSERTNQTVEIALRCMLGGDATRYDKWVDYLPIVEHEYNSTNQESTGMAPNELRFTIKPRSLADLMLPIEGSSETAEGLAEELRNRQDEARDSIAVAQRKQRRYFDEKRRKKEFDVGDLIILKFNRFGPGYKPSKPHDHKLAPLGTPLRIIEKLSPVSYRLALPPHMRIHDVVSIVHMRAYKGTAVDIRPLPLQIDDHEEFEVERIDRQRTNSQGTREYLVKWKGYGEKERTWEPTAHLERADEALADWHASQPETADRKRSRTKSNRKEIDLPDGEEIQSNDHDNRRVTRTRTRRDRK